MATCRQHRWEIGTRLASLGIAGAGLWTAKASSSIAADRNDEAVRAAKESARWYARCLRHRPQLYVRRIGPRPWNIRLGAEPSPILIANLLDAHRAAGHGRRRALWEWRLLRIRRRFAIKARNARHSVRSSRDLRLGLNEGAESRARLHQPSARNGAFGPTIERERPNGSYGPYPSWPRWPLSHVSYPWPTIPGV
jgi:hypothetical protein